MPSENSTANGKVLSLKDKNGDKTIAKILAEKHPGGQPINSSCLVSHEKANPSTHSSTKSTITQLKGQLKKQNCHMDPLVRTLFNGEDF